MTNRDFRQPFPSTAHLSTVTLFGLVHALVDTTCATVLYAGCRLHGMSDSQSFSLIVAYNIVAFGVQPVLGLAIDSLRIPRGAAIGGVALLLAGVLLVPVDAWVCVALVAVGNALFHVGCGAQVLSLKRASAALPGLFVGPGALGLSLGVWMGHHALLPVMPLSVALVAAIAILVAIRPVEDVRELSAVVPRQQWIPAAVVLLLFAVAVRAVCGRTGLNPNAGEAGIWFGLGAAACAGKIVGGFVADRIGWVTTVIAVLVVATPLLVLGSKVPMTAVVGIFVFQMAMPVTLAATGVCLPKRSGLAFGLTCLALLVGSAPTFVPLLRECLTWYITVSLIGIAAVAAYVALKLVAGSLAQSTEGSAASPDR